MKYNNISEYVATLTEEEKIEYKDLIEECQTRETNLMESSIRTKEALESIKDNFTRVGERARDLSTHLNLVKEDLQFIQYTNSLKNKK